MKFLLLLQFFQRKVFANTQVSEKFCGLVQQPDFGEEYENGKYIEYLYDIFADYLNLYDEFTDNHLAQAPDPTKSSRRTREIHRYQRRIVSAPGLLKNK